MWYMLPVHSMSVDCSWLAGVLGLDDFGMRMKMGGEVRIEIEMGDEMIWDKWGWN